jgi:hypothetical protein
MGEWGGGRKRSAPIRHSGLDPESIFLATRVKKKGGSRIKSGMTGKD